MTPKGLELLKALIEADRWWRTRREAGEIMSMDDRGIEVSRLMTGVSPRTAEQLVNLGVAEVVQIRGRQNYIFLGKYDPFDVPKSAGEPDSPG